LSDEAKIAFGKARLASGEASQQPLALGKLQSLDYLLIMRNINGYNRSLKEAINLTKLVGC